MKRSPDSTEFDSERSLKRLRTNTPVTPLALEEFPNVVLFSPGLLNTRKKKGWRAETRKVPSTVTIADTPILALGSPREEGLSVYSSAIAAISPVLARPICESGITRPLPQSGEQMYCNDARAISPAAASKKVISTPSSPFRAPPKSLSRSVGAGGTSNLRGLVSRRSSVSSENSGASQDPQLGLSLDSGDELAGIFASAATIKDSEKGALRQSALGTGICRELESPAPPLLSP